MSLTATILVPTTGDRGEVLRYSLPSILGQTISDLEVFVIGDGAGPSTRDVVHELMKSDDRIRFFDHPKGSRRGERYRHEALQEARGRIVGYLCDRDYMLPDHVATLGTLLTEADFATTLPFRVDPDGTFGFSFTWDLGVEFHRRRILAGLAFIPLSVAGHTLEAYRRLPHGWRTTPDHVPTDLFMWQQFLAERWLTAVSGTRPTLLYFPTARHGRDYAQRARLLHEWHARVQDQEWDDLLLREVLDGVWRDRAALDQRLHQTAGMRFRDLLVRHRVRHRLRAALAFLGGNRGASPGE